MCQALADGPHLRRAEEAVVEEVRAVTEKNHQMGQDSRCSWSVRVGSGREAEVGGREKVFGQV